MRRKEEREWVEVATTIERRETKKIKGVKNKSCTIHLGRYKIQLPINNLFNSQVRINQNVNSFKCGLSIFNL